MRGWDDYKDIFGYTLTTPMRHVYLYVNQNGFAYRIKDSLEQKLIEEAWALRNAYRDRQKDWIKQVHGVEIFSFWDWKESPEQLDAMLSWLRDHHKHPDDSGEGEASQVIQTYYLPTLNSDKPRRSFWNYLEEQYSHYSKLYDAVEVAPPRESPIEPGSLREKVVNALRASIKDLLRPVKVRDWQINCLGKVSDRDARRLLEPSYMAGYGVFTEVYQPDRVEQYFEAIKAFKRLGKGDIVKGMVRAIDLGQEKEATQVPS